MCPSSGLWGGVLDCDSQFTILSPQSFDEPQLWRSASVCSSLYLLTSAHCAHCSPSIKGVHRCRFRCLQMSMSNVDSVPCKCRWKCRKYIDLSREKSLKSPESYVEKMQNHMLIYIYIHTYTHTHTHTQKGSFFKNFHEKKCQKLGTDSKKCQCWLKRPANVEHMSMSTVPPNADPIWSTSVNPLTLDPSVVGLIPPCTCWRKDTITRLCTSHTCVTWSAKRLSFSPSCISSFLSLV